MIAVKVCPEGTTEIPLNAGANETELVVTAVGDNVDPSGSGVADLQQLLTGSDQTVRHRRRHLRRRRRRRHLRRRRRCRRRHHAIY